MVTDPRAKEGATRPKSILLRPSDQLSSHQLLVPTPLIALRLKGFLFTWNLPIRGGILSKISLEFIIRQIVVGDDVNMRVFLGVRKKLSSSITL